MAVKICPTCHQPMSESKNSSTDKSKVFTAMGTSPRPVTRKWRGRIRVGTGEYDADGNPILVDITDEADADRYYNSPEFTQGLADFHKNREQVIASPQQTKPQQADLLRFATDEANQTYKELESFGLLPNSNTLEYIRKKVSPGNQSMLLTWAGGEVAKENAAQSHREARIRREKEKIRQRNNQEMMNYFESLDPELRRWAMGLEGEPKLNY